METIVLKNAKIGASNPCFVIAEVAQAHEGSLGMAHSYIDAAARCGVDAIKFQTHIASQESTLAEPWRIKFSRQDETRYDYWKRMEFTTEQWIGLKNHAEEKGLVFMSSPFSFQSVDMLKSMGVEIWKIASGEVNNLPLVTYLLETKLPILFSSGISTYEELDCVVNLTKAAGISYGLLQCTTAYPCPPEKVGLNVMNELGERYRCPVGLSDHTGDIWASIAAVALGAKVLELHVAFSKEQFGPDVSSSVTFDELGKLIQGIRKVERMLFNPVNKIEIAEEMMPLRHIFTKSVVANQDIEAGTVLDLSLLGIKKPGTGIPANELTSVVGRRLKRALLKDEQLQLGDLEEL